MLVSEAITLLSASELKQLAVRTDETAVIGFINLGILELYKRFLLWESEAVITQADGISLYTLDGTDVNVTIDLSDKQLVKILKVWNEDDEKYTLNNEKDPDSLKTPKYNQIYVNTIVPAYTMKVDFQAAPLFLTVNTQAIPLPPQLFDPLFAYVGYKGQLSVKAGVKDENNTYYQRFQASCDQVKLDGLFIQNDLESTKFDDRGFV